jgi:hypothetical protein
MTQKPVSREPSEEDVAATIEGFEQLLVENDRVQRRVVASVAYERLVRREIDPEAYAREIRRSVQEPTDEVEDHKLDALQAERQRLLEEATARSAQLELELQRYRHDLVEARWMGLRVFFGMTARFLVAPLLIAAGIAAITVRGLAHLSFNSLSFLDAWVTLVTTAATVYVYWHMRRRAEFRQGNTESERPAARRDLCDKVDNCVHVGNS